MRTKPAQKRSRLQYDVTFVGEASAPCQFTDKQLQTLKKLLKCDPTPAFLQNVGLALLSFPISKSNVDNATPKKVADKFRTASKQALNLWNIVSSFSDTESGLYFQSRRSDKSLAEMQQLLAQDKARVGLRQFENYLLRFVEACNAALLLVPDKARRGRMPNFAEQRLASTIAFALQEHAGTRPALTRGGTYEQVLSWALTECGKPKRSDLMDLMRQGVEAWGGFARLE